MEESSVGSESVQSSISSGQGSRAGGESIGEREQRGSGEGTQEAPLLSLFSLVYRHFLLPFSALAFSTSQAT